MHSHCNVLAWFSSLSFHRPLDCKSKYLNERKKERKIRFFFLVHFVNSLLRTLFYAYLINVMSIETTNIRATCFCCSAYANRCCDAVNFYTRIDYEYKNDAFHAHTQNAQSIAPFFLLFIDQFTIFQSRPEIAISLFSRESNNNSKSPQIFEFNIHRYIYVLNYLDELRSRSKPSI